MSTEITKSPMAEQAGIRAALGQNYDTDKYIYGREYLSSIHKKLMAGTAVNIVCTGDSTTAGDATTSPYRIWELIPNAANKLGLNGVTATNRGQSGKAAFDWISTYLAGDLALNPDVMVIRWGLNDPYFGKTAADTIASLRSGLTTIRAARNLASLSIVLCMPNSTNDSPNGRDVAYDLALRTGMIGLAREFFCCYVDIFGYLPDSPSASDWMDAPYGDASIHIHPQNVGNIWIAGLLSDALFPRGLWLAIGRNQHTNVGGATLSLTPQSAITAYPYGLSTFRATAGSPAWPFDGFVVTELSYDGYAFQTNFAYQNAAEAGFATRQYKGASGWTPFVTHAKTPTAVTPATGYALGATVEAMSVGLNGYVASGYGYVSKTTPGAIVAGTVVATVAAEVRPPVGCYGVPLACWDGTNWEFPRALITNTGQVTLQEATTLITQRVYFGSASWTIK